MPWTFLGSNSEPWLAHGLRAACHWCRLAETGLDSLLTAFLRASNGAADPLRRTREGATALQVAKSKQHDAVAAALQQLTEQAARQAEDSLLQASAHVLWMTASPATFLCT